MGASTRIFVCFEPHYQGCAERLGAWAHTNQDRAFYNRRLEVPVNSPAAEAIKRVLRAQIKEAEITVCLISQSTHHDEWIAWELETSKSGPDRNGLVGVVLHEFDAHPPAMVDSGAIFVSFKQDAVERAIDWALRERHTSDDFTLLDD
jgi:hypothetical protein